MCNHNWSGFNKYAKTNGGIEMQTESKSREFCLCVESRKAFIDATMKLEKIDRRNFSSTLRHFPPFSLSDGRNASNGFDGTIKRINM